ncbi:MAG: TonB C-terminal domain-containing protein [Sulfuritalea sp.]|nr:TonB C-terminal domain-containing protein [Sulfuritalea sp.]
MGEESPILPRANKPGKRISIALAITVHLLLAAFLFYGVRWQTKATDVVEVELVRATAEPAATPPAPVAVPPAPTVEPPPPAPKPEPKPAPRKPDIAIKEKEKPKPPPKVEPKPPVNPFQEQLKRELEQTNQRKNADNALREAAQKQASAARDKAMTDYLGRIRGKIRGNIVVPPEVKGNPEAVFDVTQLPSGEILTVRLKRSSGHATLDAAIERAILKSNPLPKPQAADLFSRSLELHFRPLDD